MEIGIRNLSFKYTEKPLFDNLTLHFGEDGKPLVILGPSGSGKTTLLKLLAGLLKPYEGEISFSTGDIAPKTAFMFQEPRLLPWLSVLGNVSLPLEKDIGREEGRARAKSFLSLVGLTDKEGAYPNELSGGEAQRVSIARAFAWPAPVLLMDEPFQSLDIPLRISLMDLTLQLLEKEKRLLVAVTHNPDEAIYMGGRIIILGNPGEGIVYDRTLQLSHEDRAFGSAKAGELEREMINKLGVGSSE